MQSEQPKSECSNNNGYAEVLRRKLNRWYNDPKKLEFAVQRILRMREKIRALIEEVRTLENTPEMNAGVNNILRYLDRSGFYYRPSSGNGHHNFPGGIAEHCYGACMIALERGKDKYPRKSLIISGLFHDLCKADRFYFEGRVIKQHRASGDWHSGRSVYLLKKENHFPLTQREENAIAWHMHIEKANRDPFARLIFDADKVDCHNWSSRRRNGN